jgi:hypothetical protein
VHTFPSRLLRRRLVLAVIPVIGSKRRVKAVELPAHKIGSALQAVGVGAAVAMAVAVAVRRGVMGGGRPDDSDGFGVTHRAHRDGLQRADAT